MGRSDEKWRDLIPQELLFRTGVSAAYNLLFDETTCGEIPGAVAVD